ncbi:MAG: S1C family serine protease [Gammaproteobacteria bacterium]
MKRVRVKQAILFLIRSAVAGLAMAFVLLYYFPGLIPGSYRQDFALHNNSAPGHNGNGVVSYNQAVAVSAPAVVNVYATKVLKRRTHPLLRDPLLRRFFGDRYSVEQRNSNLGTGVIMDMVGHIITNAHVIKGADEILITLADGRQTVAAVTGVDMATDLAVLHIELDNLPSITLGDSNDLQVGDVVLAIGNPYDFGQTVTQGIVSATGRSHLGITTFEDFIQTDADINPGNSGGALITATGRLIGINTAIGTSGSQGIGFAIPVNLAVNVMQALISNGRVIRGWLGIEAQVLSQDILDTAGQKQNGIMVAAVLQGGPAETAGIMPGDILIEINNEPLFNPQQAIQMIARFRPGTRIRIAVLRGWEKMLLYATVVQRPTRADLSR